MASVEPSQEDKRNLLIRFFATIDNVLNIYYSNHTNHPEIPFVLSQVISITRRTIKSDHILQIAYLYPDCYEFSESDKNELYCIQIPQAYKYHFHKHLAKRKSEFTEKLDHWYTLNSESDEIPQADIHSLIKNSNAKADRTKITVPSPSKITKLSPKKSPSKLLRNDSSKFLFKPKDEHTEMEKNKGLSILERIKLKEQQRKSENELVTPEMKYESYINGKLEPIYNVIFQQVIGLNPNEYKSFSMHKLCEIVQDSLDYPISEAEAKDIIVEITNRVKNIQLLDNSGLQGVKISALNRTSDLKLLK